MAHKEWLFYESDAMTPEHKGAAREFIEKCDYDFAVRERDSQREYATIVNQKWREVLARVAALEAEIVGETKRADRWELMLGQHVEALREERYMVSALRDKLAVAVAALEQIANVRCAWQLSQSIAREALEKIIGK